MFHGKPEGCNSDGDDTSFHVNELGFDLNDSLEWLDSFMGLISKVKDTDEK